MHWRDPVKRTLDSHRLLFAVKALLAGSVLYFTGAFFYVSLSRLNYPFTLEWLEGAMLIQVHRILSGQLLYVEPSLDYVALIYSPLYFYLSAAFARVIGFGFLPLRLVSFFSTLGTISLVYLIVKNHTANGYISLMAAGSFLATFHISGAWFDVARVDMLALFLTLLSIFLAGQKSTTYLILAGIAISLACLTKQTYLIMLIPLSIFGFSINRARSLLTIATWMLVSGAVHSWLNWLHQGWYAFFVYKLAFSHTELLLPADFRQVFRIYWLDSIISNVPIFFLFSALYFGLFGRGGEARTKLVGMLALASGMIIISWLGILNSGAYKNVLIPSYAIFLIFAWLSINELLENAAVSDLIRTSVLLLACLQLFLLRYPIADQIPTREDLRAGQALLDEIKKEPGDVYAPYDNYLALYAHKPTFANWSALYDLEGGYGGGSEKEWRPVYSQLLTALRRRRFSQIILRDSGFWGKPTRYYQISQISYADDAFFPVTGWQIRPTVRYIPDSGIP